MPNSHEVNGSSSNNEKACLINYAHYHVGTKTLGPGFRSVLWVQGCPRHCPGCIATEWGEDKTSNLIDPKELAEILLKDSQITGITISGGEPMLQASPLIRFIQACKAIRDINYICYTGFTIEELYDDPDHPERIELLQHLDVLIDGPYMSDLNNDLGLRGSTNQRIFFLTDHLKSFDFKNAKRQVELHDENPQEQLMIGVPSSAIEHFLNYNYTNNK